MRRSRFSEAAIYAWKAKYGGWEVSEAQQLKALKAENTRLKNPLAHEGHVMDQKRLHRLHT